MAKVAGKRVAEQFTGEFCYDVFSGLHMKMKSDSLFISDMAA